MRRGAEGRIEFAEESSTATARTEDSFVDIDRARFGSVGLNSGSDWKGGGEEYAAVAESCFSRRPEEGLVGTYGNTRRGSHAPRYSR